ncbi:MAG: PAS domain S-box protein [Thiocapsa sp.]|uniref:PAS domain S-box protein n=1 Tax=Thiocapsa sp. TaxID=2024551 RepID=UPI001BD05F8F|nr:PAS domain S-box protein [Thiocapsa sp.]QVL47598.1 MAG: PAS domain S-box protein [Thiocapsa sp.]
MKQPSSLADPASPGAAMSRVHTVALTLLLAVLALAGNHFNLTLFFGLDILFGSVAVLLAIVWLGTRAGLIVAAASGVYTYFLWGHPFALLIFLAEAAFVGWHRDHARRRAREVPMLGLSVALYWALLGVPLVLLFYRLVMGMVWHQTLVVAVKQSLNGILNAALAGLVIMVVAAARRRPGSLSTREVLFTLFLLGFLLPSIFLVAWENRDLKDRLEQDLADRLRIFGVLAIHDLGRAPPATTSEAARILSHVQEMTRLFGNTLPDSAKLEVRPIGLFGGIGPTAGASQRRVARTAAEDLMILVPEDWHPSRMALWRQARYRMILPLTDPTVGAGLSIELSAAPLIEELQRTVLRLLTLLLAIAGIAILLADRFAVLLVRPLKQLVQIAAEVPARVVAGETLPIPSPGLLAEGRTLIDAFGVMANGLAESFARLAASDASLREAQAIAHLGSWDFDYVSGRLAWDVETFRLLGYAPDAVTPSLEAFYAVLPEEDGVRVRAAMEAVLTRPDGLFAVEHRVQGLDGVQRILRAEGRAYFADDGTPLRFSGAALDITSQRAVEDALRAQEERYRLVVENIDDLVVRTDAHGRFAYVSPSYCRLFGRDEAELIGHHFMPRVHPEDREHTAEAMRTLQNPPYTCRIEQRAETALGWRWLQWVDRGVLDAEGRVDAIVGIGRDITERKAAESALAEERRRLADIIAGTQVGTWEWDLVTNALTVNPRWAEMIGRRLEDLEPTTIETWRMFCHPEDLARSESAVARHLGGETDQYRCELRMLHDDGRWIWVQDQGRVSARDAHGRPLRMAGIHEDITVRQEAEIELMRRESLERELLGLASAFVEVYDEDLDPLVNRTLERLGGLTRSDRAYVFRFDRVADTMSNSHEWVAPGIEPMIGHLQQMPIEHFSASMQLLESGQAVVVPRVAELPDAWAREREVLDLQAILSVVLVPLLQNDLLIGFVGFDAVQAPRDWSEAEVRFLRVFASILVSAFERARSYSELRDSNRRYDQLAVQSRIVSWEVDAEGLYTYLSPAVEAVWGYRREALVDRKHFFDLVPELLRDSVKAEVMPGFARLDHFTDLVNPIRCADGSTIWVLSNAVPVVAEDGTLLGYRGTDVDITERHRAQEQLEQSEARLSAVVENAPIGIAIADPDGRVHLANRALGEFLGYAPQDLLGMHFDEFTCPDDVTTELDLFRELAAGQRNLYRMTKRYRKADGTMAWGDLRVVLLPGRAEDRPMALGMVEDITEFQAATERKRELEAVLLHYTKNLESLVDLASRALPASEELRALLQMGCEGLGMAAADIGAIGADRTYRAVARYPHADGSQVGSVPAACVGLDADAQEPGIPHILVGSQLPEGARQAGYVSCVRMALQWTGPGGRASALVIRFWGRADFRALSGPDRELVRLIGQRIVASHYEEQLQAALIGAKERETIGHLASGVAHDFNNLLGVIDANLYYLEAILSGEQGDPEVAQVIEETQSALGQAKVVTSGMLSLSRAGGIVPESVALEKTIRELVTILRQLLPAKINLNLDLEPGLAAMSNSAFLQAALLNLVLNARDAMPDGGDLLIAARTVAWDAPVPLAVGRLDPGEYVQIRVVDTGCGMADEVLERLFEPLFSTKAKQRGHGLGMFMVQEFVMRSGAGLAVSSQVGRGTEFRLLMPIDHQESQQLDLTASSNAPSTKPLLRVLVVDDDPRVRDSVGRLLMLDGMLVSFAENGQDALDRLRRDADFDLVLSDLAMPVLDGAALCAALAQAFPDLKVILMTGQTPSAFSLEALPDAPRVLRKPIDHGALRAAIAEVSARVGS